MQSIRPLVDHRHSSTVVSSSFPNARRISLHRAPRPTPIIPAVYITAPDEEGGKTWCAVDSDPLSLSVELPDIDALEAIVEDLRKAYFELPRNAKYKNTPADLASNHQYSFQGGEEPGTIREPAIHNEPNFPELRDYGRLYATRNKTNNLATVSMPNMRQDKSGAANPHANPGKFSMFKTIKRVGRGTWKRSANLFTQNGPPSRSQPTTPTSPPGIDTVASRKKLQRPSLPQLFLEFDDTRKEVQRPDTPTGGTVNPLGIFTVPTHEPGQPFLAPSPSSSQPLIPIASTSTFSISPDSPNPSDLDKPLPEIPEIPSESTIHTSGKTQSPRTPACSPPSSATRKFSLTSLRQIFKFGSRPMTTEHTNESSLSEESGSSGAPSSRDDHDSPPHRIPRSQHRVKLNSLHFDDFNMDSLRF